MDSDKAFTIYAFAIIGAVASVLTASVAAGVATLPSFGSFVEHVAMSLAFRAAYKGIGGFQWSDWTVSLGWTREPAETVPAPGVTADATS